MTTAQSIIDRAYGLLGYKDPSETLSAADSNYALAAMNDMIDSWNTQSLFIVAMQSVSGAIAGNPVTIGSGATINTTRPVSIETGYVRNDGSDYPITWITQAQYDSISYKSTTDDSAMVGYYDKAVPTGNIYLYPAVTGTLYLTIATMLTEFADLTTSYSLAPGYRKALSYSLAEELAPGLKELPAAIPRLAANARREIRNANIVVPVMSFNVPSDTTTTSIYEG